jgi:4-amino-4-deoxy-L-arabinose transferase-like glycosyltransferase
MGMSSSLLHLRRPLTDGPAVASELAPPSAAQAHRRSIRPHHIALGLLLGLTALAYLWDLSASGYANSFYAAAVQAGTKSWKAFFFGSLDPSNFITVDKPPAALWVMEISGRIFGFSSWSMLVPEALEGVAAVALLYASIRRWFGDWAGIAAGAVFALTPVAALMFRFNNPDALLVMLLVASAYCLTRALERGATRWIVAAGAMIGFAFLAKMLQAFLVLPGFALVFMLASPWPLRKRIVQLLWAGAAVVVSCGWWVLAVAVWPVADRPMIDGSSTNNIFNLIFGYNGLGRVFGGSGDSGGGGGGISFSGSPGPLRLFNDLLGGQASWLLPAALLVLVIGLAARRRAPRLDRTRAALLLWGSWLVVTGVVFSFSSGIIHTYYTVALAPAIGAVVAIGGRRAWLSRHERATQASVGLVVAVAAGWSYVLLARASWNSWLQFVVIVCAILGLGLLSLAALPTLAPLGARLSRRLSAGGAALACAACMAGPVAFTIDTVTTPQTGSIPTAGPSTGSGIGGFGGFGGGSPVGGRHLPRTFPGAAGATRSADGGSSTGGAPSARGGSFPGGGSFAGGGSFPGGGSFAGGRSFGGRSFTGGGSFGGSASVSTALKRALQSDSDHYRWVAATSGSQSAASDELATGGDPVMAIGGFSGEGGNITLSQFKQDVAAGEIHYYVASGGGAGGFGGGGGASGRVATGFGAGRAGAGGAGGRGGASSTILSWVQTHFTKQTIGTTTVYNLTSPKSTS